jgi:hypothetical protein
MSTPTISTSPSSSNSTSTKSKSISSSDNSPVVSKDTTSGSSGSTSSVLITPSGNFVSNHNPDISGNPYPNQETSVCNTTPSATCTITFTMGSVTRSLSPQVVGNTGSVSWNWTVTQDNDGSGFSVGDWQITSVATLNGQSKSASDSMVMKVGP